MKKIIIGALALSSFITLVACSKKTDAKTKTNATSQTTTTKQNTTNKAKTTIDNINYQSNFEPIVSSSLPRIDINVKDSKMEWYTSVTSDTSAKEYADCNVIVTEGENVSDELTGQVKVRGNWTVTYAKKPLRIKFKKAQSMLGLHDGNAYKNWVLLAEFKDWSMLRNSTAFYLAHLMDKNYASDFRLVNVYLNDEYYGVYLLAEQQEVNEGRIDINKPEKNYEGTDIGYYVEYDGYYYREAENEKFSIKYNHNLVDANGKTYKEYNDQDGTYNMQNGYTIKSDVYSSTQTNFIKNYIQNAFEVCYQAIYEDKYYEFDSTYQNIVESTTLTNAKDTISKVVDIDSMVNSYLLADIACDVDIAWSSFFMDVDFSSIGDKLLRFQSPWDFDSSFGNTKGCMNGEGYYAGAIVKNVNDNEVINPWYVLFYHAEWFRDLVRDKFNAMKKNNYFTKITTYITTISNNYETDFANNYTKWGNNTEHYPDTEWELSNSPARLCTTQKESAEYLISWFNTRITKLDALYNEE